MRSSPHNGYLPTLDGWRAIAILAVLFDHAVEYSSLTHASKLAAVAHTGPNGVSLFFAISGFLICSRLLEEHRAFGKISLLRFYIRRGCRILPPALIYLLCLCFLSLFGFILVSPAELWSSVFFFRNYLPAEWINKGFGGYTIHYWSLSVEEHFYLLWPTVLVVLGRRRAKWFAVLLAACVAGWRSWNLHHQWFNQFVISGLLFGNRTDVRLDALLLACVAALVLDNQDLRARFSQLMRPWIWLLLVCIYVATQFVYVVHRARTYSLVESALIPVIVAGMVYGPYKPVFLLLESRPMKWIGRLSYSLYLWQQLFSLSTAGIAFIQRFPINVGLTFLCAWLSYRFVELPFIRLGHRLAPPSTEGREDVAVKSICNEAKAGAA